MSNRPTSPPTSVGYLQYRQMLKSQPSIYNTKGFKGMSKLTASGVPLEEEESLQLVFYLDTLMEEGKIIQYTHISAETYTPYQAVRTKNRLMGVRKGFPDYVIVTPPTLNAPGKILCIEMKRTKGGVVSPEQRVWLDALKGAGAIAEVCLGAERAKELIQKHIS